MNSLKVLVVEDEPTMRELLRDMLYQAGVTEVIECGDVACARSECGSEHFNVVMLDLGLPDGNGHELMTELKARNPQQHVVLVTADDSIESIQKAISSGANGYVVKPYSLEKILDVVNNYVMVNSSDLQQAQGLKQSH